MQQHKRLSRAVDLVIHLEPVEVDIAGVCSAFSHGDALPRVTVVFGGSCWSPFPNYWMLDSTGLRAASPARG
jgi:hypothetical protein